MLDSHLHSSKAEDMPMVHGHCENDRGENKKNLEMVDTEKVFEEVG